MFLTIYLFTTIACLISWGYIIGVCVKWAHKELKRLGIHVKKFSYTADLISLLKILAVSLCPILNIFILLELLMDADKIINGVKFELGKKFFDWK